MNARKVLMEFIALAIKKVGHQDRDKAVFTLKEIKEVINFFDEQRRLEKSPRGAL
jgi:hypothetical protein